jgi:hypothetical protein
LTGPGNFCCQELSLPSSSLAWTPFQSRFPPSVCPLPVRTPMSSHSPHLWQKQLSEKGSLSLSTLQLGGVPCFGKRPRDLKPAPGLVKRNVHVARNALHPPFSTISSRSLGVEFCNVDPSQLNPNDLSRARATGIAIQRPDAPPSSKDDEPRTSEDQAEDSLYDNDDDAGSSAPAGL